MPDIIHAGESMFLGDAAPQGESDPAAEFSPRQKRIFIVALAVVAVLSFFPIGGCASSADTHAQAIQSIDAKRDTVMGLVASSTGASVAVSFLPGDAGTPIATKLVDLSSDFLVVIAALYLEKYLLTLLGFITFKILIPLACALLAIALLVNPASVLRKTLANLAGKLALFGLAVFFAVPASLLVSGMIDQTYETSIAQTVATAEQTAQDIDTVAKSGDSTEDAGLFESIADTLQGIPGGVSSIVDQAKDALNGFIEALAVMIVTSCVIPILVLILFLWLAKSILGLNVDAPLRVLQPRSLTRRAGRAR